jgi:hypothetical protein
MDMADWNGPALRRVLASADRFNDSAMLRALRDLKMPGGRSSASLFLDTEADHLFTRVGRPFPGGARLRELDLEVDFRVAMAGSCFVSVNDLTGHHAFESAFRPEELRALSDGCSRRSR